MPIELAVSTHAKRVSWALVWKVQRGSSHYDMSKTDRCASNGSKNHGEKGRTVPDIYGNGGVFDDINRQVMMISTHESVKATEGSTEEVVEQVRQYYIGATTDKEHYDEQIELEDATEPVNCFSINFVEDTLQIDTIGLYTGNRGISVNNQLIEETKLEGDPKGTKVMTKELQLATTKGAEQKTMGGVLIKATPDSMRSCYGNTKGQRDDKDTTISHAQDNNETREPNKEASNIERQDQEEGDNKVIEGAIIRTAEPQEKRKIESTGGKKVRQRHNVDAKNVGRSI